MTKDVELAQEAGRRGAQVSVTYYEPDPGQQADCELTERGERGLPPDQKCSKGGATRMLTVRYPGGGVVMKHVCLNHALRFQDLLGRAGSVPSLS